MSSKKKPNRFYIDSYLMESLKRNPSFYIRVKTPLGINLREFCFVLVDNKRYVADVITGSLYSTFTGYCTSTQQLQLVSGGET